MLPRYYERGGGGLLYHKLGVLQCTIFFLQAVYNWQFVHCLDLWSQMLGHVTHESLRPLVYPLVQVMVGAIHLQPSSRHYPLRLHIVRTLLDLSQATATFVPVAPYLLEVSKASPFTFCEKNSQWRLVCRSLRVMGWVWLVM